MQVDALFNAMPVRREDRWVLLQQFFAGWFGPIVAGDACSAESIRAAERRLELALPAALREWYALAGMRKTVWSCQDHFLQPEELRAEGDKLLIGIENQGVVRWAIRLDALSQDDPPVWVSDQCDATRWLEETPNVSVFALAQMLLGVKFSTSTTFSANGQATDEAIAAIARTYRRLDLPDLHWPPHPTRFYGDEDLVIELCAETWIWVSGRSLATFRPAIDLITREGVTWEEVVEL